MTHSSVEEGLGQRALLGILFTLVYLSWALIFVQPDASIAAGAGADAPAARWQRGDANPPWAVIVSSSAPWYDYRHTANALSVYHLLRALGGVPRDQMLLLLSGVDHACDARNPLPGVIFAPPPGPPPGCSRRQTSTPAASEGILPWNLWTPEAVADVAVGGAGVSIETFLGVLEGRGARLPVPLTAAYLTPEMLALYDTAFLPHLDSDRDTDVIVFLIGHGYPDHFQFNLHEDLSAAEIGRAVERMRRLGRYRRLLFLLDTCQALSLCSAITSPDVVCLASSSATGFGLSSFMDRRVGLHSSSDWFQSLLREVQGGAVLCDGARVMGSREGTRSFGPVDGLQHWTLADFLCPPRQRLWEIPVVEWETFLVALTPSIITTVGRISHLRLFFLRSYSTDGYICARYREITVVHFSCRTYTSNSLVLLSIQWRTITLSLR
eukprot:gene12530-8584_t